MSAVGGSRQRIGGLAVAALAFVLPLTRGGGSARGFPGDADLGGAGRVSDGRTVRRRAGQNAGENRRDGGASIWSCGQSWWCPPRTRRSGFNAPPSRPIGCATRRSAARSGSRSFST